MRTLLILALLGAGATCGAAALAAPPTPAMLAASCTGCHGDRGNSAGPSIPTIAGQDPGAFVNAMHAFKNNQRPATVMGRLAKGYTDADFVAMARFFGAQKRANTKQALDPEKIARGRQLHLQRCKDCHHDSGRASDKDSAILAGQWLEYLHIQTGDFLAGKRPYPYMMDDAYDGLKREDLDALTHFFASQQR